MDYLLEFEGVNTNDVNQQMERGMRKKSRIYVAGHRGMVGSAIHRKLQEQGYDNVC